jgi:hypothetical protein
MNLADQLKADFARISTKSTQDAPPVRHSKPAAKTPAADKPFIPVWSDYRASLKASRASR